MHPPFVFSRERESVLIIRDFFSCKFCGFSSCFSLGAGWQHGVWVPGCFSTLLSFTRAENTLGEFGLNRSGNTYVK